MVEVGDTLRISCLATGAPPISYIWQKGITFLGNQTNTMLVISNVLASDAGSYAAIASNTNDLARSHTATVIVYTNEPCNFPWVWMANFRGDGLNCDSDFWGMTTDSQGNIYLTGSGCTTNGDADYLTIKLDPDGQVLWKSTYGDASQNDDRGLDITLDSAGNCYVTGISYSLKQSNGGDNDYLTIKYGPNGEQIWAVRYNSTPTGTSSASNDEPKRVMVDSTGCIYVIGSHGTLKYDPAGNALWTNSFAGGFLALSTNDNSVVIASFGTDGVKKLSATGDELWNASITNVNALCIGADCCIYTAAYGYDSFASSGDIQTVKLDTNGVPIWTRFYNSPNSIEKPTAMDVDRDGNVFVSGYVQAQQTGAIDILLLKYSRNGNLLWSLRFNDSANQEEFPYDLRVDQEGSVYLAGRTAWQSTAGLQYAALLLKYDGDGNLLWTSHDREGPVGHINNHFFRLRLGENGKIIVAGASTFKSDWQQYHKEFLVSSFDQVTPRLTMAGVPAPGVRQGCFVSPRGTEFDILANTNLSTANWQSIGAVTNFNGLVPFFDIDAGLHPIRFYRAKSQSP